MSAPLAPRPSQILQQKPGLKACINQAWKCKHHRNVTACARQGSATVDSPEDIDKKYVPGLNGKGNGKGKGNGNGSGNVAHSARAYDNVYAVEEPAKPKQGYAWTKQWYPLAITDHLPTDRPTAHKLMGKELVVWRDGQGEWSVMEDSCPHRLAPLSEGRIETDGTIQCAYHGWRFNSEGACTHIPQAYDADMEQRAISNNKSCVKRFPAQVHHHLLWVWPEGGTDAMLESAQKNPEVIPELADESSVIYISKWFMRYLPMSYDVLCENVLDPSHVPFSHHGVLADREKPTVLNMATTEDIQRDSGFAVMSTMKGAPAPNAPEGKSVVENKKGTLIDFKPPSLAKYKFNSAALTGQMLTYSVPVEPGRSIIFYAMIADRATAPKALKLLEMKPGWLEFKDHFKRMDVLDGDMCFLNAQDRKLEQKGRDWRGAYMMPTQMDRTVTAFRRWLSEHAGPLQYDPRSSRAAVQQELSREQLLDRYNQHVKHCTVCSTALKRFTVLQHVAAAAMAVCGLVGSAAFGAGLRFPDARLIGLAAGAAIFALAYKKIKDGRQLFIFKDYRHPDHN